MAILLHSSSPLTLRFSTAAAPLRFRRCLPRSRTCIRSGLPFPNEKARFHRELEASIGAVERACHLCVQVKKSLFSNNSSILEKNDQTPVTIADFGVQALISIELGRLFPSIPLVAEEDSCFLRSSTSNITHGEGYGGNALVNAMVNVVNDNVSTGDIRLSPEEVLDAIDRGGKSAISFNAEPATYWVLDPIDGTRGFLRGSESLYVVGLALVVEGKITLGVMGCPNWREEFSSTGDPNADNAGYSGSGVIMIAHVGCGTWRRHLNRDNLSGFQNSWVRCFVDSCQLMHEARFCIPDSQTWESLPLSALYNPTNDTDSTRDEQTILLLSTCCGSLCKYLMVASGRASVFILRAKSQTLIKAWDHAVGVICVHEAGGQVSDWSRDQLDLAADESGRRIIFPSGGVLVTNSNLHEQLLQMISHHSSIP